MLAGSVILVSGPALAAVPSYDFHIPPKPLSEALIDFAVQSNLSIGGVSGCSGRSPGLTGRHTADEALRLLVEGSNCRFRRITSDTVRILPAERPAGRTLIAVEPATPLLPPVIEVNPMVQEVVVSATKRSAVVDRLPYAISALGPEALQVAGAVSIDDVASQLASFSTTNLGPGRNKILLRGLSDGVFTGRTQSTVGVYLDDVPITYNAPDPDLHLGDLDKIEVLRGPQGTLYGGGSMSGIYRIVARKPELDDLSASARTGLATTEGGGLSDQLEGTLNVPLIKGRVAVRLMAYQDVDGGYIDDINLHQDQIDTTFRTGGRIYLRDEIDPTLTLTLGGAYQAIHSNDTQYISPSLGRLHRANLVREASTNNFSHAEVVAEKLSSVGTFRSTTSWVRHDFSSRSDATNALPLFGSYAGGGVGSYDEPSKIDMLVEDAVWISPNGGRLQWLAGLFGSLTQERTEALLSASPTAGGQSAQLLYHEHRSDNLSEAAIYGEATWSFTDALQATVGARASLTRVQTRSEVVDPQTGRGRLFNGADNGNTISPKVALSYRVKGKQLVYVSMEEGHRTGGFNTGGLIGGVFSTSPSQPGIPRRFGADELWNYEVGAKLSFFGGRLRLRTAGFYSAWKNIQTDQFLPSGLSYTANAGDGRNVGVESEAQVQLTPAWTLQANALIDQPVLQKPHPGFMAGAPLPGVPDVLAGARTEYRFPLPWGLNGLVSADARYVGRSQLTFNPYIASPMGGYVLASLSAQVSYKRWRLAAFLTNPTNETGNTFSYGNPFNFQQVREVTPQRPRSLRILLSTEF